MRFLLRVLVKIVSLHHLPQGLPKRVLLPLLVAHLNCVFQSRRSINYRLVLERQNSLKKKKYRMSERVINAGSSTETNHLIKREKTAASDPLRLHQAFSLQELVVKKKVYRLLTFINGTF
ncbi:hypothetical protein TcasGA2_TC010880 [Tribolium castaneum]|uniref:Uncharacterized protein n=1 Tax=Tribolium castaneum TaxID=7070 RepID=D6W7S6_TRICA|nr:hypothetical protein TcasGA2_TC010880 [Tribolium castaneum]